VPEELAVHAGPDVVELGEARVLEHVDDNLGRKDLSALRREAAVRRKGAARGALLADDEEQRDDECEAFRQVLDIKKDALEQSESVGLDACRCYARKGNWQRNVVE
jgi:hypothetical protein